MDTWIKLWRSLLEKSIWQGSTPEQKSVLVTLLLMANHQENDWEWKGEKFKVEPGQFVTSLESIRKSGGLGISTQNIRSSLKRFKKLQFLTYKSTKMGRVITILNWDTYQQPGNGAQQRPQQRGNKDPTKTQQLYKNVRREEGKKEPIRKRKTMLSKDFSLTDKLREYAESKNIMPGKVDELFESFREYYISHGKSMFDWDLTWYAFVRNAPRYSTWAVSSVDEGTSIRDNPKYADEIRRLENE